MNKRSFRRRVSQAAALLVAHALVFTSMPVYAAPRPSPTGVAKQSDPKPPVAAPLAPPRVTVNRTVPAVASPSSTVSFTAAPTAAEIFQARIFAEPFLPVGGEPSETENAALAAAIMQYVGGKDAEDLSAFGVFLNDHPTSAWRASLLTNLGAHYKATGYYTKAAETLMEGWQLAKDQPGRAAGATAERALSELLDLHMQFGKVETLEALMAESAGRDLHGGVTERILQARGAINILRHAHHEAIASAAVAVDQLQGYGKKGHRQHAEVAKHLASHEGASLADVSDLAQKAGMRLRLARRANGDFVPGSIVHLKSGHFSALVRQEGNRFLLADPMLNPSGEVWLTRAALLDESSDFALLPAASQAQGWETAARQGVQHIRGKCVAAGPNIGATGSNNNGQGGGGNPPPGGGSNPSPPPPSCPAPMAVYRFHSLLVSLSITDMPVRYSPPRGPSIGFQLTYNQREAFQPSTFTYSNLGPRWNHDWLSYIEDTPANPLAAAKVFLRGGGSEHLMGFAGDRYAPATGTRGVIVRTSATPIRYERQLSDGSVEVFALADTGVSPRRVFMTEWRDSAGNAAQITYDAQFRIVAVTDAIGQVTTLSYGLGSDPLKITRVTDPFGRAATFEYSAAGGLVKITDVIGITSEFVYGLGDFIRSLTTPYGTTAFSSGSTGSENFYVPNVWLEAVDPLGGKERLERVYNSAAIPSSEPANLVPQAFIDNVNLNYRNSLYWGKRAMALYPGDHTKARIMRWLWEVNSTMTLSDFMHSEKMPLENRVWYGQMGERAADSAGPDGRPAKIGRVLDDGTSQIHRYEYNPKGARTRVTDPLGRETVNEYAANEIDLLRVKQKNGGSYDLLETRTYNGQHLPLTKTEAAGQTTAYTYNSAGQVLTVTTPPRAGITENRTTTHTYDTNGYLQSANRPATGATTSFTYDGYGRVRTTTDSSNHTVTYDYDALDRPTKMTYPDGTYEEMVFNRLDQERYRDREGRWTHTFYDALRRPIATRDAAGRATTQQWCTCGSLDKLIDGNNNATTWERDAQGRVTREIRPDSTATERTYESTTSRIKQIKDPKQQVRAFDYFLDNKLKQVTYTNAQYATPNLSFTYDPSFSRQATMTDGSGTTTYVYHPAGALGAMKLASVDGPQADDTVTYAYDELRRITTRTIGGTSVTSGYDALGRVGSVSHPIGSFTLQYIGATERLQTLTYPHAATRTDTYFGTIGDNLLQEIHHRRSGGTTLSRLAYTYKPGGAIKTWTQQMEPETAKVYEYAYDPADELTAATLKTTDATPVTLKRYVYGYDKAGNRTSEQVDDASLGATINNLNQLTALQPGGALRFQGTVNEPAAVTVQGKPATVTSDNRFEGGAQVTSGTNTAAVVATDPSGNVRTNTYQVNVSGTATTFTYDLNGNLGQKVEGGNTWAYEFDAEDRLKRVVKNAAEVARFAYDGLGRRVEKIAGGMTTRYIYDGEDILREIAGAAITTYVHGPGIDEALARVDGSGVATYFHADHLHSIVQETNSAGQVVLARKYDPFGNLELGVASPGYSYNGREWDPETGLYYFRARYLDPKIGRFISEDPVLIGDRPLSELNPYSYVGNDAINEMDPSGEGIIDCAKKLAEYLAALARLQQRILENSANPDPGHTKAIEQLRKRVQELLDQLAKHCKDIKPPPMPRCFPFIIIDPCITAPDMCCNGQFVGPGGCTSA